MKLRCAPSDDQTDERLIRVTSYLRNTLHEAPDYNQLAHLAHHFSRRFQKAEGVSPSHYRTDLLEDPEKALHPYSYYMGVVTTERAYGSYA